MSLSLELERQIAAAQSEAEKYQNEIRFQKEKLADTTMYNFSSSLDALPRNVLKTRRILKGHLGKIYSLDWSLDSQSVVTAAQDGKLIVWNPRTAEKTCYVYLRSNWVMTCAFAPSGNFVASGGLDNVCSVYKLEDVCRQMKDPKFDEGEMQPIVELHGHIGFLSSCRFLNDSEILTSSGDTTCILWDIPTEKPLLTFRGHSADVMNLSLLTDRMTPGAANTFVTVGCDSTARVWDIRNGQCTRIYVGHEGDINTCSAFPDGNGFATGSDDCTARFYDLRADRELMRFGSPKTHKSSVTCLSFSRSGRGLFAGYDDCNVLLWDTLKGETSGVTAAADLRVSDISVSPDGNALASASWDNLLKIWA